MLERNDGDARSASDEGGLVDVGSLAQLPAGTTRQVTVGDDDFTLVNTGKRVVAIRDLCLRCGRSLSTAPLAGGLLTCEGCGWKYDLRRGCIEGLPSLQPEMHEVRTEDGRLFVSSAIAAPPSVP